MTVGLYAGSFDPLHCGHLRLIETATRALERLFVVAAGNATKAGSLLSLEERARLIAHSTRHLPNVAALSHDGLIVDLARELGVDVLVRGMGKEQRSELQMAATNTELARIPTLFFAPAADTNHISSRTVRERLRHEGVEGIRDLVPPPVFDHLYGLTIQ
jgi:pantetheine-phosphate adenylyltransferase